MPPPPTAHDKLAEVVLAGTAIVRGLDLDETLQSIVDAAARVTRARYGALGVLGPDRRILRFITTGLTAEQRESSATRRTGRGILGVLIDEARPLRLRKLSDDPRSGRAFRRTIRRWLVPRRARRGPRRRLRQPLSDRGRPTATSPTRTSASSCCWRAWPPSRSRTRASTRTRPSRPSRRDGRPHARVALTGAAAAVLHEHDLTEAMRLVAREAVRLLEVRLVAVAVPDEFAGVIRYEIAEGPAAATFDTSSVPLNDSFAGSVLLAGVPIHVDGRDATALGDFASAKRLAGHDVIAQPVVVGEEPVAVILAADREDGTQLGSDDHELLAVLATFAAIAVRTARSLARERARAEALARLRQTQTDAEGRRETLSRVIETQERERRRLAQDLHDRTAGGLTSVLFALRRLERELTDDAQREQLSEARKGVCRGDRGRPRPDRRPAAEGARRLRARSRRSSACARRSAAAAASACGPSWAQVSTSSRRTSRRPSTGSSRRRSRTSCAMPERAPSWSPPRCSATASWSRSRTTAAGSRRGASGTASREWSSARAWSAGRLDLESPAGGGARVRFEMEVVPA